MARTPARAAVAAAFALIALAVVLIVRGGGSVYTAYAEFDNVNGLVATGDVVVAGFKVGEITGITAQIGAYPRVTMRISSPYQLRRGARAMIELGSLAGQLNRYIAISNGTGPVLPSGATIPVTATSSPVEIDQFLSALDRRTRTELRTLLHEVRLDAAAEAVLPGLGAALALDRNRRLTYHSA